MAQKGWANLQKSRKPCQALLIAAGVGIVRSVCVSCQRMLIELKNFWFSQTDFQPFVCTATPWGMRIFLDPIPINFFLFPLIYWCFHLLAQTSGGRMCPWCTMAFTAALSLSAGTLTITAHLKAYFWLVETLFLPETFQRTEKPHRRWRQNWWGGSTSQHQARATKCQSPGGGADAGMSSGTATDICDFFYHGLWAKESAIPCKKPCFRCPLAPRMW